MARQVTLHHLSVNDPSVCLAELRQELYSYSCSEQESQLEESQVTRISPLKRQDNKGKISLSIPEWNSDCAICKPVGKLRLSVRVLEKVKRSSGCR